VFLRIKCVQIDKVRSDHFIGFTSIANEIL